MLPPIQKKRYASTKAQKKHLRAEEDKSAKSTNAIMPGHSGRCNDKRKRTEGEVGRHSKDMYMYTPPVDQNNNKTFMLPRILADKELPSL